MMSGGMHGVHGMRAGSEYAYLSEMVAHHEEAVASRGAVAAFTSR